MQFKSPKQIKIFLSQNSKNDKKPTVTSEELGYDITSGSLRTVSVNVSRIWHALLSNNADSFTVGSMLFRTAPRRSLGKWRNETEIKLC